MKSNEELMLSVQEGSEEAFNELYGRFRKQVYGFLGKKVKGDDRDEVFQVIFLKLHQKAQLYNSEYPFSPWFYTLIRNTIIDFYRGQRIDYVSLEERSLASYESEVVSIQEEQSNGPGLESLLGITDEEQLLLYKKFVEGQGYKDLEEHFGVRAASLRKRVSRLIKKLRNKEGLL